MPQWLRTTLGIVAGVLAAGASVAVIETFAHTIVSGQSVFILAAIGLGLAAFIGGIIAAFIAKVGTAAWVIAAILALLSIVNIVSFPHPIWFAPVAGLCLVIGAWASTRLHRSRAAQ